MVGARNLISGNLRGVVINGLNASGNQVLGNYIGTDVTGTLDRGNTFAGVEIVGAPNNTIGGDAGNLISGNNRRGVEITGNTATGNLVRRNSIHSNSGSGIDLGGDNLTPNDLGISLKTLYNRLNVYEAAGS